MPSLYQAHIQDFIIKLFTSQTEVTWNYTDKIFATLHKSETDARNKRRLILAKVKRINVQVTDILYIISCITSHRMTSYHVILYHIISYHIISYIIYIIISYCIIYHIISYVSYHIILYYIILYYIILYYFHACAWRRTSVRFLKLF